MHLCLRPINRFPQRLKRFGRIIVYPFVPDLAAQFLPDVIESVQIFLIISQAYLMLLSPAQIILQPPYRRQYHGYLFQLLGSQTAAFGCKFYPFVNSL